MTDARLRLAEAIARAEAQRCGHAPEAVDTIAAYTRAYWSQPHVLDPILAAARECVAGEVLANYPGLDGGPCERFDWAGGPG